MTRHFRRLGRWLDATPNRRIFGAALVVAAGSLLVGLMQGMREVVVAHYFGTHDDLDAFIAASLVPMIVMQIVGGSVGAALIPQFIGIRASQGEVAAAAFLRRVYGLVWTVLGVTAVCCLVSVHGWLPLLIGSYEEQKRRVCVRLFELYLPVMLLGGASLMWTSILNADRRFAAGAVAPVLVSCGAILGTAVMPGEGIYSLCLGTLAGYVLYGAWLARAVQRRGLPILPMWFAGDSAIRRFVHHYLPTVLSMLLGNAALMVDQGMAATLGSGSVATLAYSSKLFSLVSSVGVMALGSAIIPEVSRMVSSGDLVAVRHTVRLYAGGIILVSVPLVALMFGLSHPIVVLLFQHGQFSADDAIGVASVQAYYFLQLPCFFLAVLFVRVTSALHANHVILIAAVGNLAIHCALNLLLMPRWGVGGIALATSAAQLAACAFLFVMLMRRMGQLQRTGEP